MVMTVHFPTKSKISSVLLPLAFSMLVSGCAGLNPREQQGSIFDVQLSPESECCDDIAVTQKRGDFPQGRAPPLWSLRNNLLHVARKAPSTRAAACPSLP